MIEKSPNKLKTLQDSKIKINKKSM